MRAKQQQRAVIVGANGQLGRALLEELPEATAIELPALDITDPVAVHRFDLTGVAAVYNAADHTAVDKAEDDRASAWATNAVGPAHLAQAATKHGFILAHVSTEYVFDGTVGGPIPEHPPIAPLGVYRASKAAGELAVAGTLRHIIARTTWLIGDGHNFVRTMADLAHRGASPTVVNDQVGRPTIARDLARALIALVDRL